MSNCMVFCKRCKCNHVGIKTGLGAGGHIVNLILVVLTGLLWVVPYILIIACSGSVRCTNCGAKANRL